MTDLVWEDPPPKRLGKEPAYGYAALDQLRANPGRWARLHVYDKGSSAASAAQALRKQGYEAEGRNVDDGTGSILWARWPGDDDPDQGEDSQPKATRPAAPRGSAKAVGYPCDHCDEEQPTPAALKVHVRRHHPEQVA